MLAVDVLVWLILILIILLGYGTSFFTFSSSVLYFYPQTECMDKIYNDMEKTNESWVLEAFLMGIGDLFWIMLSGPEGREDGMRECFGWSSWLYFCCFILMATFSMLVIIVLVNLLIAMMSKTHDSVVEGSVREREWQFYQTTVWVKFIRREFVAPAPFNIFPNFYRHLFDEKHSFFAKCKSKKVEGKEVFGGFGAQLDLTDEDQKKRDERYKNTCAFLVKRYKASQLDN